MKLLREFIKKSVKEYLNEITIVTKEPKEITSETNDSIFFKTENGNEYSLLIKHNYKVDTNTKLTNDKYLFEIIGDDDNFTKIDFFDTVNNNMNKVTRNNEPLLIVGNICWIIINKLNLDKIFISCDDKRLFLYKNCEENLKDKYYFYYKYKPYKGGDNQIYLIRK